MFLKKMIKVRKYVYFRTRRGYFENQKNIHLDNLVESSLNRKRIVIVFKILGFFLLKKRNVDCDF